MDNELQTFIDRTIVPALTDRHLSQQTSPIYLAPRDAGKRLGLTTSGVIALAVRGVLREIRDSAGRRFFDPAEVERVAQLRKLKRHKRSIRR